jgi:transposase
MNYAEHVREVAAVQRSHQQVIQQMIEDQARCEAFAVAFWHRVFHRNLREHGER